MVSTVIHAVVSAEDKESITEMIHRRHSFVNLLDNTVHLLLLGHHVRTQRASLVSNVIEPKIMHDHGIPVVNTQFMRYMASNIIVHFSEVLRIILLLCSTCTSPTASSESGLLLTETKKLDVPSARSKVSGNSFNHVSSPYMMSFPSSFLSLICANHVSCVASVDVVSDSAKLRITSRKEGMEPVVMAFTRGIVIVGDVACAVKGKAAPDRIRL